MKRRFILLIVVIVLIAGFGKLMQSPPSVIDTITGATPKKKKAAQEAQPLAGRYIFCMNKKAAQLSDQKVRKQLKALVSGKTDHIITDAKLSFHIYVAETDYALIRYVNSIEKKLKDAGYDVQIRQYSSTMLLSRAVSGQYEVIFAANDLISTKDLKNADYMIMNSKEMRRAGK